MAHRAQYTKDIILPNNLQQKRIELQHQIKTIKQKQQQIRQQNNQKLFMLQKRLQYGKKKIFGFDKKMNQMTLQDQINLWNKELQSLRKQISKQQQKIRNKKQKQPQQFEMKRRHSPGSSRLISYGQDDVMKRQIQDPQQQIMRQTQEIIRLKKSLQQVRSKYSENFTEYKLRQQYSKLKKQNQQLVTQIKDLQKARYIIEASSNSYNNPVDYDQMQTVRAKKQYEIAKKQRDSLHQYLIGLQQQCEQNKNADYKKKSQYQIQKIQNLKENIERQNQRNKIIQNQIEFIDREIDKRVQYGNKLKSKAGRK